jgi:signal transduction histidine kinase
VSSERTAATPVGAVTHPAPTTQAQLLAVIESIDEGLVIADRHGNVVTINRAAHHFLGGDWRPGVRHHVREFPHVLELSTFDGRVLAITERPMARALRGETFSDVQLKVRQLATGIEMIASFSGVPVLDHRGEVDLAVLTARDITQRKRDEEALLAASREKDEFLALLGHELRNPLAPIIAGSQMLVRADLPERERRLAEMIHRQGRHLSRIVEDLLYVSGVESREAVLKLDEVDVAGLIRRIAGEVLQSFEGRELRLEAPRRRGS